MTQLTIPGLLTQTRRVIYYATVYCGYAQFSTIEQTEVFTNRRHCLNAAKALCPEPHNHNALNHITLTRQETCRSGDIIYDDTDYQWYNKGEENIGQIGNKAGLSGWFNQTK